MQSGSGLFGFLSETPKPAGLFSAPKERPGSKRGLFGLSLTSDDSAITQNSATSSALDAEPRFEIENSHPSSFDAHPSPKMRVAPEEIPVSSNVQPNLFAGFNSAQVIRPSSNLFTDLKPDLPGGSNIFSSSNVRESAYSSSIESGLGNSPSQKPSRSLFTWSKPPKQNVENSIANPFSAPKLQSKTSSLVSKPEQLEFGQQPPLYVELKPAESIVVGAPLGLFSESKLPTKPPQQLQKPNPSLSGLFSDNLSRRVSPNIFRRSNVPCTSSTSPPKTSVVPGHPDLITALKIGRVPSGLNQKVHLSKIFSRFGKIERIICQPSLDIAMIAFSTPLETQRAKTEASKLIPGIITSISKCVKRTGTPASSSSTSPKLCPSASTPNFFQTAPVKNLEYCDDMKPSTTLQRAPPTQIQSSFCGSATTVEERLAVLEARDTAEHAKGQSVATGSRKAAPAVGTCPDMCPETERYLRELRQRVSIFECLNCKSSSALWQMDHTRAVKDYSRSAADQAETPPWELRPPEVLERTMAYLLAAVADRPEIDQTRNLWKPWYEFLWTRTRAIRKDITQQRLCSLTIVAIIEKITRFHIWCAARLVDQSTDAFDPRINSENLTQCLQTLKELYNDLDCADDSDGVGGDKEASVCPREPEFRAYMILMKLNDNSMLDEVQKFPESLRKSREVQFAIAVHSAVAERNHVRFFGLVRAADCLTACLLHRYFSQVRSQALLTLSAAFAGHPKLAVWFPLSTLMHRLAFESLADAQAFCEHWGLDVEGENLLFRRHAPPRLPELAWHERRAHCLIEGKRSGQTLADLFNGGPVDPMDATPAPVNSSFSPDGRLLPTPHQMTPNLEAVLPDTRKPSLPAFQPLSREAAVPVFQMPVAATTSKTSRPTPSKTVFPKVDNEEKRSVLEAIVEEFLETECKRVLRETFIEEISLMDSMEAIMGEVIATQTKKIAAEVVKTRSSTLASAVSDVAEELISQCLRQPLRSTATVALCEELASVVLSDVLTECLSEVATTTLREAYVEHADRRRLQGRCFAAWRQLGQSSRHLVDLSRSLMRGMPAAPAHSVWLGGRGVERALEARKANAVARGARESKENWFSKRCRFSQQAEKVDYDLAWRPMEPIAGLDSNSHVRVAVVLPASSASTRSSSSPSLLVNWILAKLAPSPVFSLVFPHTNTTPDYFSDVSGLLLVDIPASKTPSSSSLPCLHLTSSPSSPPPLRSGDNSVIFPPYNGDPRLLAYTWSALLRDGLEWLADKVGPRVKQEATAPSAALVSRRCGGAYRGTETTATVAEVLQRYVKMTFLVPLLAWMQQWKELGITHPDPHHILTAYNQNLQSLAPHIPSDALIHPLPAPLSPKTSWEDGVRTWRAFENVHLPLSVSGGLEPRREAGSALLIPWGVLCTRFLHSHLEVLSNNFADVPAPPQLALVVGNESALAFNWGAQYSIAALEQELAIHTRRPLIPSGSAEANGKTRDLMQELRELEMKIADVSNDARSIWMQ